MTKYEQYLQITQATYALLDAAWAISRLGDSFPYTNAQHLKVLESLMLGNDMRVEWEKKVVKDQRRSVKLLFADYVAQRDVLMMLLRETV